jgi:hypothetical protein
MASSSCPGVNCHVIYSLYILLRNKPSFSQALSSPVKCDTKILNSRSVYRFFPLPLFSTLLQDPGFLGGGELSAKGKMGTFIFIP